MNPKGWLLLAVFLLLQVGSVVASACSQGPVGGAGAEAACAATGCCCCCVEAGQPACACAEAPAEDRTPAPLAPPSAAVRDALPSPVWLESRACAWPGRGRQGGIPAPLVRRPAAPAPSALVAPLAIRYCALVI